jgi:hypothetical protein
MILPSVVDTSQIGGGPRVSPSKSPNDVSDEEGNTIRAPLKNWPLEIMNSITLEENEG